MNNKTANGDTCLSLALRFNSTPCIAEFLLSYAHVNVNATNVNNNNMLALAISRGWPTVVKAILERKPSNIVPDEKRLAIDLLGKHNLLTDSITDFLKECEAKRVRRD